MGLNLLGGMQNESYEHSQMSKVPTAVGELCAL